MVQDFDLALTCFDPDEIAAYTIQTNQGLVDEDQTPEVQHFALTEPGDLWILGNERLLCGDSTSMNAVERLMDGHKADLVFTDPPYNVSYEGYTKEKLTIQGDGMTAQQFQEFLASAFSCYQWALKPGGSMYVCHPSSWQREFQGALESSDFEVRCQIIWAKNTFAWGFGRYKFQHEPIFYLSSLPGQGGCQVRPSRTQTYTQLCSSMPPQGAERSVVWGQIPIDLVAGEEAGRESPAPHDEAG